MQGLTSHHPASGALARTAPRGAVLLVPTSRHLLLFMLAFLYAGGLDFIHYLSPNLLYPTYGIAVLLTGICLVYGGVRLHEFRSILPYGVWLVVYIVWGTFVSVAPSSIFDLVLRVMARNTLVLLAVVACVRDRDQLSKLANLLLAVAVLNCAIELLQLWSPRIYALSLFNTDPVTEYAYSLTARPAALWGNPNEAAFAFLFALLLSPWAGRGILAWLGRSAAVVGIYITASRGGSYLLLGALCGYAAWWLYLTVRSRRLPIRLALVGLSFIGIGLILYVEYIGVSPPSSLSPGYALTRILDFRETNDLIAGQDTRVDITLYALQYALSEPFWGGGIFSFQGFGDYFTINSAIGVGAHNVYIAVLGEVGYLGLALYVLALFVGIRNAMVSLLPLPDRFFTLLIWSVYLLVGFVWHDEFITVFGMILIALLYHLPSVLREGTLARDAERLKVLRS